MSEVTDPNKCDCECHGDKNVMHFMECCYACGRCGEERLLSLRTHKCPTMKKPLKWSEVKGLRTDPKRHRTRDPGDPYRCHTFSLHEKYSTDEVRTRVYEGCTKATMGCFECKKILIGEAA